MTVEQIARAVGSTSSTVYRYVEVQGGRGQHGDSGVSAMNSLSRDPDPSRRRPARWAGFVWFERGTRASRHVTTPYDLGITGPQFDGRDEFAAMSTEELTVAYQEATQDMQAAYKAAAAAGAYDPLQPERDWTDADDVPKRNAAALLNAAVDRDVVLRAAVIKRHERERKEQSEQIRRDWNAQHGNPADDADTNRAGYTTVAVANYTPPPDGPSPMQAGSPLPSEAPPDSPKINTWREQR